MTTIRAKVLINSKEFVREPVDKEVNNILECANNKIILTGGKGVGKSTVLRSLENRGLGSKEQTIFDNPEGIITISKEPKSLKYAYLFDYMTELNFTNNILLYIKNNYPIIFEKYFKKDKEKINILFDFLDEQIEQSLYKKIKFNCKYSLKELSVDILNRFRQIFEIEKLNIAVDRFDNMNGSSEYMQNAYKEYFDLFDKVILSVDDENLDKIHLYEQGYSINEINYGNDKYVLKEIIRRKVQSYNKDNRIKIEQELFTNDLIIDKLIKLDGNINMYFDIIDCVKQLLLFEGKKFDLDEATNKSIEYVKESNKKIYEMTPKSKLYL